MVNANLTHNHSFYQGQGQEDHSWLPCSKLPPYGRIASSEAGRLFAYPTLAYPRGEKCISA